MAQNLSLFETATLLRNIVETPGFSSNPIGSAAYQVDVLQAFADKAGGPITEGQLTGVSRIADPLFSEVSQFASNELRVRRSGYGAPAPTRSPLPAATDPLSDPFVPLYRSSPTSTAPTPAPATPAPTTGLSAEGRKHYDGMFARMSREVLLDQSIPANTPPAAIVDMLGERMAASIPAPMGISDPMTGMYLPPTAQQMREHARLQQTVRDQYSGNNPDVVDRFTTAVGEEAAKLHTQYTTSTSRRNRMSPDAYRQMADRAEQILGHSISATPEQMLEGRMGAVASRDNAHAQHLSAMMAAAIPTWNKDVDRWKKICSFGIAGRHSSQQKENMRAELEAGIQPCLALLNNQLAQLHKSCGELKLDTMNAYLDTPAFNTAGLQEARGPQAVASGLMQAAQGGEQMVDALAQMRQTRAKIGAEIEACAVGAGLKDKQAAKLRQEVFAVAMASFRDGSGAATIGGTPSASVGQANAALKAARDNAPSR